MTLLKFVIIVYAHMFVCDIYNNCWLVIILMMAFVHPRCLLSLDYLVNFLDWLLWSVICLFYRTL